MRLRHWGIVVSLFYAAVVLVLLVPVVMSTVPKFKYWQDVHGIGAFLAKLIEPLRGLSAEPTWWVWVGILIGGQVLLLFLSVDTSIRMLKPRQHVAVTAGLVTLMVALLTLAAILSLAAAGLGDKVFDWFLYPGDSKASSIHTWKALAWLAVLWTAWGVVFWLYYRGKSVAVSTAVAWLLRGSVLELLVAVPAHIWVQRREVCSAPAVTGFGIATGIAVMLLAFGPGVIALYRKRIDAYRNRPGRSG